jgi:NAD(P)-dependent dehydrogenase (short-subunit alcohol dehydrogenase family)
MKTALILGITADIGRELGARFARDGWHIVGTHRPGAKLGPASAAWDLLPCDLSSNESVDRAIQACRSRSLAWDLVVVAAGTEQPIGDFFRCGADAWEQGIAVNALAPLRFIRGIHELRRQPGAAHVAFFSGAGTNNAAPAYSAYCAAKIFLIKMCELLDAESADTSFFIVGPGIVRTKIHQQTLDAPEQSGPNHQKVVDFLQSSNPGTSHDEIYECLRWCLAAGKAVVGGRNLSLVHDGWRQGGAGLARALEGNRDLYKLRRFGNDLRFFPPIS